MSRDLLDHQLRSPLAYLKLSAAAQALPTQLDGTRDADIGHTEFIEALLAIEVGATEPRRWDARMRPANFPVPWIIGDFDFTAQYTVDEAMIRQLAACSFRDDGTNVLLIGPAGAAKTMLAIALGHAAVDQRHRVYCTTAVDLTAWCRKAALESRWAATMRFFSGPEVLIIEELGFLPMPAEDASAPFQIITRRYLKGSIILEIPGGDLEWCLGRKRTERLYDSVQTDRAVSPVAIRSAAEAGASLG